MLLPFLLVFDILELLKSVSDDASFLNHYFLQFIMPLTFLN